eukprot:jgi/Ulvmu1/101/UM001_0104.1
MVSADFIFPFAADLLFSEPVQCAPASRGVKHHKSRRTPKAAIATRPILVDIKETHSEFEILADLPGVAKGDIQIDIDKDTVTLGVKPAVREPEAPAQPVPDVSAPHDKPAAAPDAPKQNGAAETDAAVPAPESAADAKGKTERKVHRQERSLRFVNRALKLPETADLSHADASFVDGVLRIVVAKKELPSPKRIRIA